MYLFALIGILSVWLGGIVLTKQYCSKVTGNWGINDFLRYGLSGLWTIAYGFFVIWVLR